MYEFERNYERLRVLKKTELNLWSLVSEPNLPLWVLTPPVTEERPIEKKKKKKEKKKKGKEGRGRFVLR